MAQALKHDGHTVQGVGVLCKRCGSPSVRYERTKRNLAELKEHALNNGVDPPVVMLFTDWCEVPTCKTSSITDVAAKHRYVRALDAWTPLD